MSKTTEDYATKIMEVAYHNFPLVPPKESVHSVIKELIMEYAKKSACYCFGKSICKNCKKYKKIT